MVCLVPLGRAQETEGEPVIDVLCRGIEHRHQLLSDVELGYTEERYYNHRDFGTEHHHSLRQFRWLVREGWCRAESRVVAEEGERSPQDRHEIVISDGSTVLRYDPARKHVEIEDADGENYGNAGFIAELAGLTVPGELSGWLRNLRTECAPPQRDTVDEVEAWKLVRRDEDFLSALWIAPQSDYLTVHAEGLLDRKTDGWTAKGWVRAVTATERLPNGAIVPKEKKTVWYLVDEEGRRTWTWLFRYRLIHARLGADRVLPHPMSLDWLPMGTTLKHPLWTETVGGEVDEELIEAIRDGALPSNEEVWDGVQVRLADSVVR
jgi:hypothetical protein